MSTPINSTIKGGFTVGTLQLVLSIGVVIIGIWFVYALGREMKDIGLIRSFHVFPEMENNDQSAVANVVELLKEADRELEIFDDGDSFPESTYNDQLFLSAVREKLQNNPHFRIRCFFNRGDSDLEFIKMFRDDPQVEIYVRKDGPRPPDRHYKIIDGGKKAYLSKHSLGHHIRRYKEITRAELSPSQEARASELLFGDLRQKVEKFRRIGEHS